MFGFVFSASANNECFVWELLNSHATYIWKNINFENSFDLSKVVEEAIITIKNVGREPYKKYYNSIELPTYDFRVIDHSLNNLTDEERFNEWKKKLERFFCVRKKNFEVPITSEYLSCLQIWVRKIFSFSGTYRYILIKIIILE